MAKAIDIKLLFRLILKKWYLFAAMGLVSLFVAFVVTADARPDVYQAVAGVSSIVEGSSTESLNGIRLLINYSSLLKSSRIATAARGMLPDSFALTAKQIQAMVSTSFSESSTILYITSSSTDPQLALSVANAVAEAFVAEIGNITGDDTIRIYDRATSVNKTTDGKSEQRKTRLIIPAVSLFILLAAVVLWALFSDRLKSVSEAEFGGEVTILGVIPRI
jgi:capsular polysaccharide biosynthesis protein